MNSNLSEAVWSRQPRCHVRLGCVLLVGETSVPGTVTNLSAGGMYVRASPHNPIGSDLLTDSLVTVSLTLPKDSSALPLLTRVVWLNADDCDERGQTSFGMGLSFVELPANLVARIEQFVAEFRPTICVVDDDAVILRTLQRVLQSEYDVICCASGPDALAALDSSEVSVLITDQAMSPMTGLELLEAIRHRYPRRHLIKIVLTGMADLAALEDFVNVGRIFHFCNKPLSVGELRNAIRRGVEAHLLEVENEHLQRHLAWANQRLERENAFLRKRVTAGSAPFDGIVGRSQSLRRALDELARAAQSDVTVHLRGETGTGKELAARALHNGGPRAKGNFVVQNCAGVTETLMQSTLFGHQRGAFTGATRDQPGLFQRADGGTIFLDEVAELSPAMQGHLLRVLQEGEITPVGSNHPLEVDVRVISATHKDLREEVRQGRFREDLYFRLVVMQTTLPPLRERIEDIVILAQHFLALHCERQGKQVAGFTPEAVRVLEAYPWPGNVRELENEIERAVVMADEATKVEPRVLSPHLLEPRSTPALPTAATAAAADSSSFLNRADAELGQGLGLDDVLHQMEREILLMVRGQCHGNQSAMARRLGIPRQTLRNRMKKLDVSE